MTGSRPTQIRVSKDRRQLTIAFDDGSAHSFSAEMLRVLSPSAEVQGHSPEQRVIVPGKIDVAIERIEPVGRYAVRIIFDDRHDTGIFSWDYFRRLGREGDKLWQEYLDGLAEKGLSRERRQR